MYLVGHKHDINLCDIQYREQDINAKKLELERVNEINKSHQSRVKHDVTL